MSLIHCPECGKEISDKSEKCIHCGYPIRQSGIYETIDNKEYELNFLKDNALSKFDKIKQINILRISIVHLLKLTIIIISPNVLPVAQPT